jgi:diadenosine tetraphosphatase ApaH/serine/threonine PP2A family protein phosphatase
LFFWDVPVMKYAILSDIHGNLTALKRVLDECERLGIEDFLITGDVVGYGAQPNECCEAVRDLRAAVIRGNHDEAAVRPGKEEWFTSAAKACILWTREVLTEDNREFLEDLRPTHQLAGAHLCHGSLPDPDLYTSTPLEALLTFRMMEEPLCFLGHTHYAEWYVYRNNNRSPSHHARPQGGECRLVGERLYLVNAGAVGQPRDGNSQASFATWDTEARLVTIHRVSYDIAAAQQRILDAGLPTNMAERLKYGI